MQIPHLHDWPKDAKSAIALQSQLAERVSLRPLRRRARLFAGTDVAFTPDRKHAIAGVVVWDATRREVVEQRVAHAACPLPYIPGLLSFRELPAVLRALQILQTEPDVILCDGQGYAHPRRLGLATHLGLWLQCPTVGCAKSRLCGEHDHVEQARGARAALWLKGEQVGFVLRTRDNVKPLYVSPGNRCNIENACTLTLQAATRYRLPEPTRLAHHLVTRSKAADRQRSPTS